MQERWCEDSGFIAIKGIKNKIKSFQDKETLFFFFFSKPQHSKGVIIALTTNPKSFSMACGEAMSSTHEHCHNCVILQVLL